MMDKTYRVSVVMPCYNAQGTLKETLDSALAQSVQDFCIIAVNDGSQDQTGDILADYAQRHPEKMQIVSQVNQGQTVAKNVAIRAGQSEYIAFLDSDDLWDAEKLQKQVAVLDEHPDVGLCYTAAKQVNMRGDQVGRIGVRAAIQGRCHDELIKGNQIVASSVMVRRSAVVQAGLYDETFRACENWDLWIRIAREWKIAYIDEPLTSYRVHPNNMSKNFEKMMNARLRVIDKHLPGDSVDPMTKRLRTDSLFQTHMAFAKGHIEALRMSEARQLLFKTLLLKPTCWSGYKLYAKTLLGAKLFQLARKIRSGSV